MLHQMRRRRDAAGFSVVAFTNSAVEGCLSQFPIEIKEAVYG